MSLYNYLTRLEDTLRSRRDITLKDLRLTLKALGAILVANLHFYDGSQLNIVEEVERVGSRGIRRIAYKFHYQQADGTLIFRYDNSPHHPSLATFPSHKHVGSTVIEAQAPDLTDVLCEIDAIIYKPPSE